VKIFYAVYGTKILNNVFKKPATGPYPEPDKSNPHHHTAFLQLPLIFNGFNLNIFTP
jgi:hypothetical protein